MGTRRLGRARFTCGYIQAVGFLRLNGIGKNLQFLLALRVHSKGFGEGQQKEDEENQGDIQTQPEPLVNCGL